MGHRKGSPERDVHSNTSLPKKDRNITNKQPNAKRTGRTTRDKAQNEQKEGNNLAQTRIRIKQHRD